MGSTPRVQLPVTLSPSPGGQAAVQPTYLVLLTDGGQHPGSREHPPSRPPAIRPSQADLQALAPCCPAHGSREALDTPAYRRGSASLGPFRPGPQHCLTEGSGRRSARDVGPRRVRQGRRPLRQPQAGPDPGAGSGGSAQSGPSIVGSQQTNMVPERKQSSGGAISTRSGPRDEEVSGECPDRGQRRASAAPLRGSVSPCELWTRSPPLATARHL